MQLLLLPDPRPIVERLGVDFFRLAPEKPGVYLMRDASEKVLYVGKAKNLRKRLANYRVANPERLRKRHLRLLHSVSRIELEECPDEAAALARESELLLSLRPRFNRAGTWKGEAKYLAWRLRPEGLDMAVVSSPEPHWHFYGPLGSGATWWRATLIRLLWCALQSETGLAAMPQGWFHGPVTGIITILRLEAAHDEFTEACNRLNELFAGQTNEFIEWIRQRTATRSSLFELGVLEEDLETVSRFKRLKREVVNRG